MVHEVQMGTRKRMSFSRISEVLDMPDLIEVQKNSYKRFVEEDLREVLDDISPITDYTEKLVLEFVDYSIDFDHPKYSVEECKERDVNYCAPLKVLVRLINKETGEVKEQPVFMGDFPLMTEQGTFIINGAERVIVSQLVRSPGVYYTRSIDKLGKNLYSAQVIPNRGAWLEYETDSSEVLHVKIDRQRKVYITALLRALGYGTNAEIIELMGEEERLMNTLDKDTTKSVEDGLIEIYKRQRPGEPPTEESARSLLNALFFDRRYDLARVGRYKFNKKLSLTARISGQISADDVIDPATGEIIVEAGKRISAEAAERIENTGVRGIFVTAEDKRIKVLGNLFVDAKHFLSFDPEEAGLNERVHYPTLMQLLKEGEGMDEEELKALLKEHVYDLIPRHILPDDMIASISYLIGMNYGIGRTDDIDHLGNRRIRSVGELLQNQIRVGMTRLERVVRERMSIQDMETAMPSNLINIRPVTAAIKEFFGSSQLSQFMDQTNPLAELTHKRRLSALGPGGLNRDRATFDVRDVHYSHYGRMCPIETPEGPNIGLINSLSTYARINKYGFIEAPYRKVDGKNHSISSDIVYLTADEEDDFIVAQANEATVTTEEGNTWFAKDHVVARWLDKIIEVPAEQVHYMDVSPKQLVSVATAMIPFLENDDANRALMGSNMQRQAVPLLMPEAPVVGTGMEYKAAHDSGVVVVAHEDATVIYVAADKVVTEDASGIRHTYKLIKFKRSNQGTCINQRPIVNVGDKVKVGDVLADGASTEHGEIALGRNILIGFMTWEGYNYEDAVLISEKLVKDDVYTSIHIEEHETEARDTKLGKEEITRDIPNVGEDALSDLDERGIIRIGAEVRSGDILVGKVTPKGETELTAEERLLRAIFGEKAADVKDTSLVVPSGVKGIIMDVKTTTKSDRENEKVSTSDIRRRTRKINEEHRAQTDKLRDDLTEALSNVLLGEKIPLDVRNSETGEVIIQANRKITKTLLRRLAAVSKNIDIDPSPVRIKIMEIVDNYQRRFDEIEKERARKVDSIENGEGSDQNVIKTVKVYIATKRKIQVGDKMAGRHGNKGIVARIVPEEDMPYLPDGTPVEICLNPMGVPSRMNVGQVLETHLGWACKKLGIKVATPVFDGISEKDIRRYLKDSGLPESGKVRLIDGLTGEYFDQEIVVGYIYMMKLNHLVADKIHARAVGPYSLITQQPLGGKAQYGGQRFGEMEVWALEAYGAAYTLQELLTVKSDDVQGRTKIYEQLVKGDSSCLLYTSPSHET